MSRATRRYLTTMAAGAVAAIVGANLALRAASAARLEDWVMFGVLAVSVVIAGRNMGR